MPLGEGEQEPHVERGVAPIIGVILMVAIAIILAVVVGAFALGFGEETSESTPAISVELDREVVDSDVAGNERIIIKHGGGDTVPVSELQIATEAQCFDDATFTSSTKRGTLVSLPVDPPGGGGGGIDNAENVEGDEIFETAPQATPAPLSGNDETWGAGERLVFQIDDDQCGVESSARVGVEIIHQPSNTRLADESLGTGLSSAVLTNEFDPATPDAESTHTWVLDGITYGSSGNSGDEVDTITVDYDPNGNGVDADYPGLDEGDITVTMTRTLSTGPDRSDITVNSGTYSGTSATFDLSGIYQTDVAGPIEIEIDGIENPGSVGSFPVEITLDGDAGQKTFTETLEIEN